MIGIGIDTGGTCTDAVIYDSDTGAILGAGKALTTKSNLEIGIANALDALPKELVAKASRLALSTTLATNAAVENKGARARLLLIGFDPSMMERLKDIYASYGFGDMDQFIVIDAKVEKIYSNPYDPDWEDLKARLDEYFGDCDAVGVVQKHPKSNGGRFELTARKLLEENLDIPVTIAFDISNEVDILKCCAGTMLNARLIPLIAEFMKAVKNVMADRGLCVPISIVRSDGTLMSEMMASELPVETLLCGPAASVIGGSTIARQKDAIVVDMGGTTTDMAIVHDGEALTADDGILIGQWRTMVRGMFVDTIGLGGDSAVRYRKKKLYLDTVRVIPICVLASQYPYVRDKLYELSQRMVFHGCWIHEFYVLQKSIEGKTGYTKEEQYVCELLKDGPMITLDLAAALDRDPHYIRLERLERDGIIMKAGLTPTDMMVIRGDFSLYDGEASRLAVECMAINIDLSTEDIPDAVYDLVCRRMYKSIGRMLFGQKYKSKAAYMDKETIDTWLDLSYDEAKSHIEDENASKVEDMRLEIATDMPLVGVGAPIHIFLPTVARLLHTRAIIPEYAHVANALGSIAGRVVARCMISVKAEYKDGYCYGYSLFENGEYKLFGEYPDAVACARRVVKETVRARAAKQGIAAHVEPVLTINEIKSMPDNSGVLFETQITAVIADT